MKFFLDIIVQYSSMCSSGFNSNSNRLDWANYNWKNKLLEVF